MQRSGIAALTFLLAVLLAHATEPTRIGGIDLVWPCDRKRLARRSLTIRQKDRIRSAAARANASGSP